jgi:hypothetical protein
MNLRSGLLLAIVVLLSGCASLTTYNKDREFSRDGDHALFIDAKQRAVITNVSEETTTTAEGKTVTKASLRRYCAEPSPDALSAFAASMGLNLSVPTKGDLGYSQAFTEGAASIGLRTQSIQILRDITYRDCEAFINGGLTKFGLETLQRRFQSTLVAVLAIEQLTGVVKTPAIVLSGQANGIDANALAAAIKLVDEKEAVAKATQTTQETADTVAAAAQADFDKFKTDNPTVKDEPNATDESGKNYQKLKKAATDASDKAKLAKAENTKRQADLTDAKALRLAAATAGKSGSINAIIEADPAQKSLDVVSVSTAVSKIVEDTLNLGFGREVCTTIFGQIASVDAGDLTHVPMSKIVDSCIKNLEQNILTAKAQSDLTTAIAKQVDSTTNLINELMTKVKAGNMPAEDIKKWVAPISELQKKTPTPPSFAPMFKVPGQLFGK